LGKRPSSLGEEFNTGFARKGFKGSSVGRNAVHMDNGILEPKQRAHSSLLAAGLASKLKIDTIPYGRRFPVVCCVELQSSASKTTGFSR